MTRRILPSQAELIAQLEARHAHRNLRFSSAFLGSHPVQASGRIGGMCFYFRFRWDKASLTLGHYDHARHAHYIKRDQTKARRQLRRGQGPVWLAAWVMRPEHKATDYPSRAIFAASRSGVTGEQLAGHLEPHQAAALFEELLAALAPVSAHLPPTRSLIHRGRKP